MRLWSLHPQCLDPKGLVAVWREGLLARRVLQGMTKGYKHHPQLQRFDQQTIDAYLHYIASYANQICGYRFDISKVTNPSVGQIPVSDQQIKYETEHLIRKLETRNPKYIQKVSEKSHPIFKVVKGPIEAWEKI